MHLTSPFEFYVFEALNEEHPYEGVVSISFEVQTEDPQLIASSTFSSDCHVAAWVNKMLDTRKLLCQLKS